MELIDKSAVIAEIERIEYETNYEPFTDEVLGKRKICKDIKDFINTLETKEVDLEKEIDEYMKLHHLHIKDGGRIIFENDDTPNFTCDFHDIANHFFELGIKSTERRISYEKQI